MSRWARFRDWLFTPTGSLVYFGVAYALIALIAVWVIE